MTYVFGVDRSWSREIGVVMGDVSADGRWWYARRASSAAVLSGRCGRNGRNRAETHSVDGMSRVVVNPHRSR